MKKKIKNGKIDGQRIGLAGRNWLISQLFQGGIEVAKPERDRGVDLIAYLERPQFVACPVQVKSSLKPQFTVYDKKYKAMLLVFVWHVDDSTKTVAYALTSSDARRIARTRGFLKTPAWKKYGNYRVPNPGPELQLLLEPYKMTPHRWKAKIRQSIRRARN